MDILLVGEQQGEWCMLLLHFLYYSEIYARSEFDVCFIITYLST